MNDTTAKLSLPMIDRNMRQNFIIVGVLLVIILVFSIMSSAFFTVENFVSVLLNSVPVAIVAIAEAVCVAGMYFDMSVGMVASLAGIVTAACITDLGMSVGMAVIVGLIAGLFMGALAGLSISRLGMNAFITTLALTEVYRGIVYLATGGVPLPLVQNPEFGVLGQTSVLGIQLPIVFMLALYVLMALFMRYTRLGRSVYLIGNNPKAAHICGINIKRVQMFMFLLSGVLASFAGILLASRTLVAQAFVGQNYAFEAIAASIIGGTAITGGKCNLATVFVGVMIVYFVKNGLVLVGLQDFYQYVAVGAIVFLGVLIQVRRDRT